MDRVVKCDNDQCGLHFMYTEIDKNCPFCHTEYGAVEEKKPEEEAPKEKKMTAPSQKGSFKVWKNG